MSDTQFLKTTSLLLFGYICFMVSLFIPKIQWQNRILLFMISLLCFYFFYDLKRSEKEKSKEININTKEEAK